MDSARSHRWSSTFEGKRMDSARHTEKFMNANQDSTSSSVAPEVLRTSRGAYAPAFVALRAPLRQTQPSYLDSGFLEKDGIIN